MKMVYPYPTLLGDVSMSVEAATVEFDSGEVKLAPLARISRAERTVALNGLDGGSWSAVDLRVQATLPQRELEEGPWQATSCVALLSESATNARAVLCLTPRRNGEYAGTIRLHRAMHRARATLTFQVIAEIAGQPGRLIGEAQDPWYVDLKDASPVRQKEIELNQVDFQEGPEEWLRNFRDAPWLVDTSGEMPTVHLNTAMEGLIELLHGGRTPLERAMRDQLASQIAGEAWSVMFHSAMAELELDEDGSPQMPDGWRAMVLATMLPDVFPDRSPTDALIELYTHRTDGRGWAEIQSRIQYAAAKRSRLPRNLTTLVRTLDRITEGAAR
jgi:hypothetical protein